jgi:hypothetical protein
VARHESRGDPHVARRGFALKGFAEPVAVYRIEQTHRTRVIVDQYIVATDLKGFSAFTTTAAPALVESVLDGLLEAVTRVREEFNGVVRFGIGDAYCLTFDDVTAAMTGARNLLALWEAVLDKTGAPCPMHVAVHNGTLYAFRSYLYGTDLSIAFGWSIQSIPAKRAAHSS